MPARGWCCSLSPQSCCRNQKQGKHAGLMLSVLAIWAHSALSSLSLNSIYSVHSSHLSLSLAVNSCSLIVTVWLTFWCTVVSNYLPIGVAGVLQAGFLKGNASLFSWSVPLSSATSFASLSSFNHYSGMVFNVLFVRFAPCPPFPFLAFTLLWLSVANWIGDLTVESYLCTTATEQLSLVNGVKLLILSELMLFVACF